MVLDNAIAAANSHQRPHAMPHLNILRKLLLKDAFFDPSHKPEELRLRMRPSRILFMDLVVLLSRVLRVLMRREPLTEEAKRERIAVRNEALDQPFFDRMLLTNTPFARDEEEDEGCSV